SLPGWICAGVAPIRGHQPISPIYSEPVPLLSETAQFRNFWRLPHVINPPESSRTLVASFRNRPIPNNIRTRLPRGELTLYRQARTVNPINPTRKEQHMALSKEHHERETAHSLQESRRLLNDALKQLNLCEDAYLGREDADWEKVARLADKAFIAAQAS